MTVRDFLELSIEPSFQEVELYDTEEGEVICKSTADDILFEDEFTDMEVDSFDVIDKHSTVLTLNVSNY